MRPRLISSLALLLFRMLLAPPSVAQELASTPGVPETSKETVAQEVELCVAQHDNARQLRLSENWSQARAAMLQCADDRCPLVIGADCRAWLEELAQVLPSLLIVVEREDPASQQQALHVELDGQPLELAEPPVPIELFPGPHQLRVQLGQHAPVERRFVLQKAEKNHLEQVRFSSPRALAPQLAGRPRPTRPIPVTTYVLSGGAVLAFAGAAALLAAGLREHSEAQVTCAPACKPNVRQSIETRLVLADVAAGAGLVLGGLGVYTFVRRPVVAAAALRPGPTFATSGDGLTLLWRGRF